MTANWNQTWTPKTDKEIDEMVEKAKSKPEPRPLSLVRFADDSMFRKTYFPKDDYGEYEQANYSNLLYLGPIPNQYGHGAYVNLKSNITHVIDIEELVELTEDET